MRAAALLLCAVAAWGQSGFERKLDEAIEGQRKQKEIPAVAMAVIAGGKVVYQKSFGAPADAIFRVGSVSKLYTAVAVMQLMEAGRLDLDAPIGRYLPWFSSSSITLRQIMTHRSGLTREPAVGHYFDDSAPTLEATVRSLSTSKPPYAPGVRTKYSNAAVGVEGMVVEAVTGVPFAEHMRKAVLEPLGMRSSSFALRGINQARLPKGQMWTYDGRRFDAPVFDLGFAPAGNLFSTIDDQVRFLQSLLDGGAPLLKRETLEAMWKGQQYGLAFRLGTLGKHRTVGHGGAVYGFSTEVLLLPDEKVAVVAAGTKDSSNAVLRRLVEYAARSALGEEAVFETTQPLEKGKAHAMAGRYGAGDDAIDLLARGQKLYVEPVRGGQRYEVRSLKGELVVDDTLAFGKRIQLAKKTTVAKPGPTRWAKYIGEYGWDFNTLYILEKEGQLTALIEWFDYYPLKQIGPDQFVFPDWGMYDGEPVRFESKNGRITAAIVNGVRFLKRETAEGAFFQIKPRAPVSQLRTNALKATPPKEQGSFLPSSLTDLTKGDPRIRLDVRYAGTNNFLGTPVYPAARAFMQKPAAAAVHRANAKLNKLGYGLLIHDAYRPWYVTKIFWDATPDDKRIFVADPSKGSRHNRGCAVDLTLYHLDTGKPAEMTGLYDEMTTRSYPDYPGGTALARWHRELLRDAMESEGFTVFEVEWWHFDYNDWPKYSIHNLDFDSIERSGATAAGAVK